jgi:hypothetical protein
MEVLLGWMLLALGSGSVAPGRMDAVFLSTAWVLREAMAIVPALALVDGADDLAVCEGERGRALQVLWRTGGADIAEGGHDRSPGMRELRRV